MTTNFVSDFDECLSEHFHDCSTNAYCFNIRGTYTCSCKEGFADLSENPVYPGRVCSAEQIGCEKCHYHGSCYTIGGLIDKDFEHSTFSQSNEVKCECFQWYSGANCQINLKGRPHPHRAHIVIVVYTLMRKIMVFVVVAVLLLGLVLLGGILFTLLLICLILTCWKRNRNQLNRRRTLVPGIGILPHKSITCRGPSRAGSLGIGDNPSKSDQRAMIEETSSETSEDTCTLPYVTKKVSTCNA